MKRLALFVTLFMLASPPPANAKAPPHRDRQAFQLQLLAGEPAETTTLLNDIMTLQWREPAGASSDTRRVNLDKLFHATQAHNLTVRQAETEIKDARRQAKEAGELNLFALLNPIQPVILKQAAENNVQAAEAGLMDVRQQETLRSAQLYAALCQAALGKKLAFQAIEQGRMQLKAELQRFTGGDTDRFAVTQAEVTLIDRYEKFLKADNAYRAASMTLAAQAGLDANDTLLPEDIAIQDERPAVTPLKLIPADLDLKQVRRIAKTRPALREAGFRRDALKLLAKAASGIDRQKKEAELHQLELEIEKGADAAELMAEKAFNDYQLAAQSLNLTHQRFDLAQQSLRQLEVSTQAGFSSRKDLLDGQVEFSKAQAALVAAQLTYNLSQLQLVYEMGLLSEDILTRPLALPPNSL